MKNILRIGYLLIFPILLVAQIGALNPYTMVDIVGNSTTVPLSTKEIDVRSIQLTAKSTNLNPIRYGDINTSSSRGTPIESGAKDSIGTVGNVYLNMANIYVNISTNDVLCVTYWTTVYR